MRPLTEFLITIFRLDPPTSCFFVVEAMLHPSDTIDLDKQHIHGQENLPHLRSPRNYVLQFIVHYALHNAFKPII